MSVAGTTPDTGAAVTTCDPNPPEEVSDTVNPSGAETVIGAPRLLPATVYDTGDEGFEYEWEIIFRLAVEVVIDVVGGGSTSPLSATYTGATPLAANRA